MSPPDDECECKWSVTSWSSRLREGHSIAAARRSAGGWKSHQRWETSSAHRCRDQYFLEGCMDADHTRRKRLQRRDRDCRDQKKDAIGGESRTFSATSLAVSSEVTFGDNKFIPLNFCSVNEQSTHTSSGRKESNCLNHICTKTRKSDCLI